ncbi:hypothetical protein C8N43_2701 [Litoreibacter ponti]|uniref:Uncharacterized protein n=1 Tax=Litoreibacter ponti TaxID=1510457 RepID=A0A2T6BPN0_9RHOB|nr:hypothetical protein [Litoreibacter ponti]PTX58025.1 hypothetical protein C8N43_2701 [Litoreibacter ponti]
MRHILDQHAPGTSSTARRWAYAMQRRAMPSKGTLVLQRRKRNSDSSARPQHFLRIARGVEA